MEVLGGEVDWKTLFAHLAMKKSLSTVSVGLLLAAVVWEVSRGSKDRILNPLTSKIIESRYDL